ncbi:hypothetical protein BJY04DRAFT_228306 [Aspergillus karnatakaensis]|uniref:Zn(II)2Cys6 transcription factor n=1 Tax=Aspergillus karnatakaensis TaxID=1810916 RepID=UPI003CCD8774
MPMSRARASKNCANCRAVKRRCDKQVPHCGQCLRQREKCPGYRDNWDLVFRNQTSETIQRSQKKQVSKADRFPPPRLCMGPHMNEIGANYFLHHFVTGDQSSSRGYLNYIPAVYSNDGEHPTLLASMAAVGLMALANSTKQAELASHARLKYTEAIRNVNAALASPTESIKDSTLMSIISLGVFEHFSDFQSWVRHVRGAAALMVVRGKSQFRSPAAILMFHQVRTDLSIVCMHTSQQLPPGIEALQEEVSRHIDTSSASWTMGVLATRCVKLLWHVDKNEEKVPWLDLFDQAVRLQEDFQLALGILAIQEPYMTNCGDSLDPDLIYNNRYDLYRTPWAIRLWNNSRNLQMIVCEIICYLTNKVFLVVPDLSIAVRAQIKATLQETLCIMSTLSDGILASVPQILGVVSTQSPGNGLAVDPPVSAGVAGGYMLVWGLYMVGKSPATGDKARKWIIRRLGDIVENSGIALAQRLLDQIVEIDQVANQ